MKKCDFLPRLPLIHFQTLQTPYFGKLRAPIVTSYLLVSTELSTQSEKMPEKTNDIVTLLTWKMK